jgi:hypothetical protein
MRVCVLLVALVSAAGLSACGGSSGVSTSRSSTTSTATPPAASAVPPAHLRDPAAYRYDVAHGARAVGDPASGSFWLRSTTGAKDIVVTVHGHNDSAERAYSLWVPYAKEHGLGIVAVEWQTKWGRGARFLDDAATYGLIRRAVRAQGTAPGHVLLHGFSQGSHEAFAVTALDRGGPRLFALTMAESGGVHDGHTSDPAFAASRWDIYCAGRDPWPQLSGCPAMRHARAYLLASGATVGRFMVDPPAHHGGFLLNRPDVESVLGDFERIAPA